MSRCAAVCVCVCNSVCVCTSMCASTNPCVHRLWLTACTPLASAGCWLCTAWACVAVWSTSPLLSAFASSSIACRPKGTSRRGRLPWHCSTSPAHGQCRHADVTWSCISLYYLTAARLTRCRPTTSPVVQYVRGHRGPSTLLPRQGASASLAVLVVALNAALHG